MLNFISKRFLVFFLVLFSLTFTTYSNESVLASNEELSDVEKEKIFKSLSKVYEDKEVVENLTKKIIKDELFDSERAEMEYLGVEEQVDDYTKLTTYPDGSIIEEKIDYAEALFYDEYGKEIEVSSEDVSSMARASSVISGGSWSKGTGYACVKGIKVSKISYGKFGITFKADFCNNKNSYDNLSRVYGVNVWANHSFSIMSKGVFRKKETSQYSAYGGVKAKVKSRADGRESTEHLYLRVGKNKYWYTSSY